MKQTVTLFKATFIAILAIVNFAKAQTPQAIPYQAAARNASGVVLVNKTIGLRFTLHDATATGTTVYQETQNATTNAVGMFIVNIGQGTVVSGTFASINWASGSKFMQVEYDSTASGSKYVDLGTQQLMSVPYALNSGNGVPVGTIVAFMGTTPPAGWLLCDHSAISRSTYSNLYAVIGTSSGIGNGSTTFNLPETRGYFLRGVNGGTTTDPDASSRVASYSAGGNSGDAVGSVQFDAYASHNHPSNPTNSNYLEVYLFSNQSQGGQYDFTGNTASSSHWSAATRTITGNSGGSSETRPKNVYVNYIIKY